MSIEGDTSLQVAPGVSGIVIEGGAGTAPILQAVDGSQISDGDTFYIRNQPYNQTTLQRFEFDSGFTLHMPERYQLQLPATGGRGINDGETFRVANSSTGANVTFEFDRDGIRSDPNFVPIAYASVDTPAQLASKVVTALGTAAAKSGLGADGPGRRIGPSGQHRRPHARCRQQPQSGRDGPTRRDRRRRDLPDQRRPGTHDRL